MLPPFEFYMDDSGSPKPDKRPQAFNPARSDHFALGGVLIAGEDVDSLRAVHAVFCKTWGISYPLHSYEIRNRNNNFTWLKNDPVLREKFMISLTEAILQMPIIAVACVIDRPGYDARYREAHPAGMWHMCKTAFSVAVERAAKYARLGGRPLRVHPEASSKAMDEKLKGYYVDLKTQGLPFDPATSKMYEPLDAKGFAETLVEFKCKTKSSEPMQIADLCLWPIARHGYGTGGAPYNLLRDAGKLIEARIRPELHATCGTKYSCFELVHGARNNKGPEAVPSL